MAQYGVLIDSYQPDHEEVYKNFVIYFNDPILTKMKNTNGYTMYIGKIAASLGIEYRYIIVFVNQDNERIGFQEKLSNLKWLSLQTRTLKENHTLSQHSYTPRRLSGLDKKISLTNYDGKSYVYSVEELPLSVVLLPTGKINGMEYNKSGTLVTALETYNTIVTFL